MHLIDASDKRNMLYVSQEVFDCMQRIPPIDPESLRPQGEWIVQDIGRTKFSCSRCKARNYGGHEKYCPNCGAKMKGGNT